jgi:hypothetical protein
MSAARKTGPMLLRDQPSPWPVGLHLHLCENLPVY